MAGLFSEKELRAVTALARLGFERDRALLALIDARWSLEKALEALQAHPGASPAGEASVRASSVDESLCLHGCGRTRKTRASVCCNSCRPGLGAHTETCNKRERGRATTSLSKATDQTASSSSPSASPAAQLCPICLKGHVLIPMPDACNQ